MADRTMLDVKGWQDGLKRLSGGLGVRLARSMAVAGGEILRDEAKARINSVNGVLAAAIYLAFKETRSNDKQVMYSVTWNKSKAPHGHLVEFGHWQIYAVVRKPDGTFITDPRRRLRTPKWVPAHPFLRPALNAARGRAQQAMLARGRQRLPELLAEGGTGNGASAADHGAT